MTEGEFLSAGEQRFWAVRAWLTRQHSSMAALAREMGITHAATRKLLMAETIPPYRHSQLIELGVPEAMLAPAVEKRAVETASLKSSSSD